MLLKKLFDIVDYNDKNYKNIEFYSNNITTKVLSIVNIFRKSEKTTVVIVDNKKTAETLSQDLLTFEDDVYIYPEIDILKRFTNKSNDLEQLSLEILNNLVNKKKMILIIPTATLYRTLKSPKDFKNYSINISLDNYINFSDFSKCLLDMGYTLVDSVENIGEYSKRGGIIDFYSPLNKYPIRLDYFDEELDTIRIFDTISQKSLEKIDNVDIYPTDDFFLSVKEKDYIVFKLEEELTKQNFKNFSNYKEIENYLKNKIKLYRDSNIFDELTSFSNYIYDNPYSIVDYLPNDSVIIFDNYTKINAKITELKDYFTVNLGEINHHYIFQNVIDNEAFEKLQNIINKKYYLSILKSTEKFIDSSVNINITDLSFYSSEEQLAKELKNKVIEDYEIVITVSSKKQRDYLEKILFDYNLYDDVYVGIHHGKIHIEETKYNLKGFESKLKKFILITPLEIFKDAKRRKKRKSFKNSNSEKIRNYQDLNIGDYIVHIHHGIGIYEGIENIAVSGVYKDFLKIVYEGGDVIYVDIENMKYIQKYMSSTDNRKPKLNKLGTKKWQQVRNKVRREIEDISEELIKLYIKRELNVGYAFSEDGIMQKEFEQDFLFTATEDQEKVTSEIKKDMEKNRPMDRLLCGDVGFGKTEVAMRVAFKAVVDSKQVAVLVPTTLLSEQHYNNFKERFSNFPVNIEVVSRFNTSKEISRIVNDLESGKIDIIIGTHKLLNDKFKYKDLGLLIIDEEQRFGVKHKEKIKHLKNMIDVLTLSATPIPRSLHMSLIGIRDLSVIETPPRDRQPIQTFVMSENPNVIREAVLKEVDRQGQVFYVYNRVETIEEKYLELKKLLPEVNIAYAHGRMTQKELENIMIDVINKEYDMLITTTIIETGIDISNVNTLIIEDADKFGLSQLYQIRGRVGRSSREAYAYFMYKPFKVLTDSSEKRLTAIKDFTSLGSGFKIAMQDLSIRGSGDVLGGRQHGFIDSVGYTLYSQMLEKELAEKKEILEPLIKEDKTQDIAYYEQVIKEKTRDVTYDIFDVEDNLIDIKLHIDAFIPKDYINNDADKIYFYKEINNAKTEEDVAIITEELIDRFSDFGLEVENLLDLTILKINSLSILVNSVKELANKVIITFEKEVLDNLNGKLLFEILSSSNDIRIMVKDTLVIEVDKGDKYSLKRLIKLVKEIKPSIN
ncbi:transcription-repair coupling factor [Gemella sp. GH3]|uniref:transcription-repair coupling factor n=1 Tax=unclassified Gemella TaxID=2624949 RepID=UPI0015D056A3|nr:MULTISPECIES: transcription-repair coupling factor [unclassified Gemella]MBF0713890.1 transcription-repair coupling factor [Gemella sp. GH3.1]NYS50842.1 transcription-repair coupling factor [Gemella sp. GH3]